MVPYTDLTQDDIKSILNMFSSPTPFTKEQLEDIVRSISLCYLKSTVDFPLIGQELDIALDKKFGANNRTLVAKLKPTKFLTQLGLIGKVQP